MSRNKVKGVCAALSLSGASHESICGSLKGIGHVLLQLIRSAVQIFHSCNNRTETVGTRLTDYSRTESNNRACSSPVAIDNLRRHHCISTESSWWNAKAIHSPHFSSPYTMRCDVMFDAVELWIHPAVTVRAVLLFWGGDSRSIGLLISGGWCFASCGCG